MVGLSGQLFDSKAMYRFKMKLPCNEEEFFCAKNKLLSFKITLRLAKLDIVGSRLVSNGFIVLDDILFDIQSGNGFSTLSIKDKPFFSHGSKRLPKKSPEGSILCNWVLNNFTLAD